MLEEDVGFVIVYAVTGIYMEAFVVFAKKKWENDKK
jgi:hypothetical protein